MENIQRLIKHQLNSFEQNSQTYTNTRAEDTESRFKKELDIILEKINSVRMENNKYSKDLIKKTSEVEIDYKKLSEIKSEIISSLDLKIHHMVNMHQETYSEFDGLKSEHIKIKMRFNELSDFLKNSKNQIGTGNSTMSIKDMKRLSVKINFSNEKGKKVSSQNLNSIYNNDSSMDENNLKDSMNLNLNKQSSSRKIFNELNNNYNNNNDNNLNNNLEDINNPSSIYYIERRKILVQSESNFGNISNGNLPEINEKNLSKNLNKEFKLELNSNINSNNNNNHNNNMPNSLNLKPDLKNEKLKEKTNLKKSKKEYIDNNNNNNINLYQKKNRNPNINLINEYNTLDKLYKSCDSSISNKSHEKKYNAQNFPIDKDNNNNNIDLIDGISIRAQTAKIKNLKDLRNNYFIKDYTVELFEKNIKNDFRRNQMIINNIENTKEKFPDLNNTIICLSEFNENIKIFKGEFIKKSSNLDQRFIQLENFVKKKLEELAIKIKYYLPIKFNPYIYIKNFGNNNYNNNQGSDIEEKEINNNNKNKNKNDYFNAEKIDKNPSKSKSNNYQVLVSNESNKNGNEKKQIKFINIKEKEEKRNM
jgi:hypothetical protein